MSDVMPALGPRITEMRPITNPDGTIGLQEVVVQETKVEKYKRADGTTGERTVWLTDSGRGAIIETGVISETHTIKVKAFDRAGNEVESRPVQIIIGHKPKPKKTSWLEGGAQWSGVGNQGTGVRSQPTVAREIAVALKPAINRPDRVALAGWTANGATQPNPQAPAAPAPSADLLIC